MGKIRTHLLEATEDPVSWTFSTYEDLLLERVTLNFDSAPTTDENITVTIKSKEGTAYDQNVTPSSSDPVGTTSFTLELAVPVAIGDSILVEYANTDAASVTGAAVVHLY